MTKGTPGRSGGAASAKYTKESSIEVLHPSGAVRIAFAEPERPSTDERRVVLLDRDGVINRRMVGGYVLSPSEFTFLDGVMEALQVLRQNQFITLVVSNQACIGKQLLTRRAYRELTELWCLHVLRNGGFINGVYTCPHTPDDRCTCRKPKPGLLEAACNDWKFQPATTYFVGDSSGDVQAGRSFGCPTILVGSEPEASVEPTFYAPSVREAVEIILGG